MARLPSRHIMKAVFLALLATLQLVQGFSLRTAPPLALRRHRTGPLARVVLFSESPEVAGAEGTDAAEVPEAGASSLEEKMAAWEATDEERAAASLGGLTPGSSGGFDGFDFGLALAFPLIVGTALLFLLFPFIGPQLAMDAGPPPMT